MGGSTVKAEGAPEIVLASASSARARMLNDAGVVHTCCPAHVDEAAVKCKWTGGPEGLALDLATTKALQVSTQRPRALVIGADQVLAFGDEVFDKPGTVDGVRAHLQSLRGHTHALISAVAVAQGGSILWSTVDRATLNMREFSDGFLNAYIAEVGEEVAHSVGAYHLEGLGAQLFDAIQGDHFTVLGLPLIALLNYLRSQGALKT